MRTLEPRSYWRVVLLLESCSTDRRQSVSLLVRTGPNPGTGHRLEKGRRQISIRSLPGLDQGPQSRPRRRATGAQRKLEHVRPAGMSVDLHVAEARDHEQRQLRLMTIRGM